MINFKLSAHAAHCETFARQAKNAAAHDTALIDFEYLLKYMTMLSSELNRLQEEIILELRRQGKSWSDIGTLFGMSRQSAWERYSGLCYEYESDPTAVE